jgi:hypothetical protein
MSTIPFPEFTPPARRRWEKVPPWAREKILDAVWCGNCLTGTPMQVRIGKMQDDCLILEGTCKICGNDAFRVIEPEE